jgi:hypothetical protein
MSATIRHSFDDVFLVFDYVKRDLIGEIVLMSDGWAAYRTNANGRMIEERIGTYANAELAIRAIDNHYQEAKRARAHA